jgi:hypothetical protein
VSSEPFIEECLSTKRNRGDNRTEVPSDGGYPGVDGGTNPILHAAVTRTIPPKPRPVLMPDINHKEVIPMSQRQPEIVEIAEGMGEGKRLVMRIFSRDGVIDEEEFAALEQLNRTERRTYQHADDQAFALALTRVGRHSDRVQRMERQIFPIPVPNHDDAA